MDERLNLVRRAVRRKPGAFETLMEQEKEYLYKMAFLYCREEQMALDTVAETVAKAYVGIGKLKKPEYFRTWLTRILINEALRAKEKSGTWLPWEEAVLQKENSMAPIREYSREEIMDLRDALQRLPEDFRELVLMKYFYEFSVKEISEITGSSEGAVRTRLCRIRKLLKKDLEGPVRQEQVQDAEAPDKQAEDGRRQALGQFCHRRSPP